ncbi:MAG: hypothetical protein GX621_16795 [Pirellulaceae bacterium]|nr:hypothetical protein [Pirellulaceae bacterium]
MVVIARRVMIFACFLVSAATLGCRLAMHEPATLPNRHEFVREQLVFHSDVELPEHHRLLSELAARRVDLSQELMLPISDEPIHVFVFEDRDRWNAFVEQHHPHLPRRRAFFLKRDTRLEVYTQWGDRVAEDLRHEITHAYLASVVSDLPLWLDEGLAEYFEVPRGCLGINRPHVDLLVGLLESGQWSPNLQRLEAMPHDTDMNQIDYAEAWAWTHLLLTGDPVRREVLRAYLREIHQSGHAAPLSARIVPPDGKAAAELTAHLRRLATPGA